MTTKPDPLKNMEDHILGMVPPDTPAPSEMTAATEDPPAPEEKSEEQRQKALTRPEYTWTFQPMQDGKPHPLYGPATFTHRCPTIRTQRSIGLRRSALNMGIPESSLDKFTNDLHLMLATFALCLDVSANPEEHWAHDFEALVDDDVLYQLWDEVQTHVATFRGRGAAPAKGS